MPCPVNNAVAGVWHCLGHGADRLDKGCILTANDEQPRAIQPFQRVHLVAPFHDRLLLGEEIVPPHLFGHVHDGACDGFIIQIGLGNELGQQRFGDAAEFADAAHLNQAFAFSLALRAIGGGVAVHGNDGPQALRGQPGDFKADIAAHGKPDGDDITINAGQCLFGHGGDAVHAECIGKSDGISASQGSNLSIIEARCQQQPRDKKQCWHRAFPLNPTLYAITVDLRPAIM